MSCWATSTAKMRQTSCIKNAFRNVLLVIIFNYRIYSNVPTLKSFYEPAFSDIILCGPEANSEYGVHQVNISKRYFGYYCLATAIREKPNFEGYLYVNDDMIVNFWNLANFNKNRIWEGPRSTITVDSYRPPEVWYWWKSRWGMSRCNETFYEIFQLMRKSENLSRLKKALQILKKNGEGRYLCNRGRSDISYLPGKFTEIFKLLADIF